MRISFDFDDTLDFNKKLQQLAKILVESGNEVFVLTARSKLLNNDDLFSLITELGIKKENVIFSAPHEKYNKVDQLKLDLHFDNDLREVAIINTEITRDSAICVGITLGKIKYLNT